MVVLMPMEIIGSLSSLYGVYTTPSVILTMLITLSCSGSQDYGVGSQGGNGNNCVDHSGTHVDGDHWDCKGQTCQYCNDGKIVPIKRDPFGERATTKGR